MTFAVSISGPLRSIDRLERDAAVAADGGVEPVGDRHRRSARHQDQSRRIDTERGQPALDLLRPLAPQRLVGAFGAALIGVADDPYLEIAVRQQSGELAQLLLGLVVVEDFIRIVGEEDRGRRDEAVEPRRRAVGDGLQLRKLLTQFRVLLAELVILRGQPGDLLVARLRLRAHRLAHLVEARLQALQAFCDAGLRCGKLIRRGHEPDPVDDPVRRRGRSERVDQWRGLELARLDSRNGHACLAVIEVEP